MDIEGKNSRLRAYRGGQGRWEQAQATAKRNRPKIWDNDARFGSRMMMMCPAGSHTGLGKGGRRGDSTSRSTAARSVVSSGINDCLAHTLGARGCSNDGHRI